jgi:hypothetical protein
MKQHEQDASEPTWPERVQEFSRLGEPMFRRIRAAHEEGDYETRDRLWRAVENLRAKHGLR